MQYINFSAASRLFIPHLFPLNTLYTSYTLHHWCYFPLMQMDEALLFKVYDSADDGRARFTLHTSCDDPAVKGATGMARESIETRCFVFWDKN